MRAPFRVLCRAHNCSEQIFAENKCIFSPPASFRNGGDLVLRARCRDSLGGRLPSYLGVGARLGRRALSSYGCSVAKRPLVGWLNGTNVFSFIHRRVAEPLVGSVLPANGKLGGDFNGADGEPGLETS